MTKPEGWTEPHNTRMVRKFGNMAAFEKVKKCHGLIPRGAEVGLDKSCNFHQPQLDKRIQSSTLRSHKLILYVANRFGLDASEKLYAEFNKRHFTAAGILNDRKLLVGSLEVLAVSEQELKETVAFLDDPKRGIKEVLTLSNRVLSMRIHSIPTLIVDAAHELSGAQRSEVVFELLARVAAKGPTGKRLFGDVRVT